MDEDISMITASLADKEATATGSWGKHSAVCPPGMHIVGLDVYSKVGFRKTDICKESAFS